MWSCWFLRMQAVMPPHMKVSLTRSVAAPFYCPELSTVKTESLDCLISTMQLICVKFLILCFTAGECVHIIQCVILGIMRTP